MRRSGRLPKRATTTSPVTITIRIDPDVKNGLIDQANAYDLSISEYITSIIRRETTPTNH